jgi:hypothetical protein
VKISLDDSEQVEDWFPDLARPTKREAPHCACGRFAKYLGGRSYYNGNFDCYSYDVDCSRCGVVTIECV